MAKTTNYQTTAFPGKKNPPALNAVKHGGFSNLAVLPGEDAEEFMKLSKELDDELKPSGPLEVDVLFHIAKLIWRKRKLGTYRRAEIARGKWAPYLVDDADPEYVLDRALKSRAVAEMQRVVRLLGDEEQVANESKLLPALKEMNSNIVELVKPDGTDTTKLLRDEEIDLRLAQLGEEITPDKLFRELEVVDRLDAMIGHAVKRLMQLKAMKQMVGLGPNA
jgi:hypothetical protein